MRLENLLILRNDLKKHIESKSIYSPKISMIASGNEFPKVVIDKTDENTDSKDNRGSRSTRNFITIQIYTKEIKTKKGTVSAKTIELELENLVKDVMEKHYNFDLVNDTNLEHALDSEIYRKVMTYRIYTFEY